MGPFSPIFFIPWLGNGYINLKGLIHRPNQTKVQDALKGRRVSLRLGLARPGRDGTAVIPARRSAGPAGRPTHSAQRHFDGYTFGLSPQRVIPLPLPHPNPTDIGKQDAAGLPISEV